MTSRPQLPDHPFTRPLFLLVAAGALLSAGALRAVDGDLDPAFRAGGSYVYSTPISGRAVALAFRSDGVPLAGYTIMLAGTDRDMRVIPVPDQGFVTHCGSYHPDLGGDDADVLTDIAVDGDRVYLAGRASGPPEDPDDRVAIAAFDLGTCALDSAFGGSDGTLVNSIHSLEPVALELASNGAPRLAIARDPGLVTADLLTYGLYATNGALDGGFTTASLDFASSGATAFDPKGMHRQPDGKLLVVGIVSFPGGDSDVGVARFLPNGALDSTFSGDGMLTFSYDIVDESNDQGNAIGVLPDRRIVVAGSILRATGTEAAVAVLTPTGGYDNGFGLVGRFSFKFSDQASSHQAVALAVQGDGRILVGGRSAASDGLFADFGIARLLPAGDDPLDPTFSGDGRRVFNFGLAGSGADELTDLALDPSGRIVAAGPVFDGDSYSLGMIRLQNGYIFADGFEWGNTAAW